jgi:hypothetical protein
MKNVGTKTVQFKAISTSALVAARAHRDADGGGARSQELAGGVGTVYQD